MIGIGPFRLSCRRRDRDLSEKLRIRIYSRFIVPWDLIPGSCAQLFTSVSSEAAHGDDEKHKGQYSTYHAAEDGTNARLAFVGWTWFSRVCWEPCRMPGSCPGGRWLVCSTENVRKVGRYPPVRRSSLRCAAIRTIILSVNEDRTKGRSGLPSTNDSIESFWYLIRRRAGVVFVPLLLSIITVEIEAMLTKDRSCIAPCELLIRISTSHYDHLRLID